MSRDTIQPIQETIPDERQKLARHYGVHPYFTRRSANVVQAYIERFTVPGDTVVDPFGGSGVTAIEALLMGRRAVHNDLNPFANFVTEAIADTSLADMRALREAFADVRDNCQNRLSAMADMSEADILSLFATLPLPENIRLHRSSDAEFYHDLFTPQQLAGLALLKQRIDQVREKSVRVPLLLAWSASLAKLNRTFLSAKGRTESRGGSSIFSIYRYKLAKQAVQLPVWETFAGRFENVVRAKQEVLQARDVFNASHPTTPMNSQTDLTISAFDAADLVERLGAQSADYVFTDPPYGGYIAYLDLSVLWNHWLGLRVTEKARHAEAIVGGEQRLTEDHYKKKLATSISACVDLLRPDRWLSVVFQHWDVSYFETILLAATGAGAELRAAVTQERDVVWSMHKKKNNETMLAGEMILTFHKPARPKRERLVRESQTALFDELLDSVLRTCRERAEVTSQFLFNRMILGAWERRSLSQLVVTREAFAEALRNRGWNYDAKRNAWVCGTRSGREDLFGAGR